MTLSKFCQLLGMLFVSVTSSCLATTVSTFDDTSVSTSAAASDDSVSALPPNTQALRDEFYLGMDAARLSDWESSEILQSTLPPVFSVQMARDDDMGQLHNRTNLRRLLQASEQSGATPIIIIESLFIETPTAATEIQEKMADPQWASYFFNQLQSVIDICNENEVNVLIIVEPRLVDALAAAAARGDDVVNIAADTESAYDMDFLDADEDPPFGNTISGFIAATNYLFAKNANARILHGWQVSTASSPQNAAPDLFSSPSETDIKAWAKSLAALFGAVRLHSYNTQIMLLQLSDSSISFEEVVAARTQFAQFSHHLYNETNAHFVWENIPPSEENADTADLKNLVNDLYASAVTGLIIAGPESANNVSAASSWLEETVGNFDGEDYPIE